MVASVGGGQPSGARMEIVGGMEEGYRVIGVGEEGAVPTVVVGSGGGMDKKGEGEEESMVEKVGRIIEENLGDGEGDEERNTSQEGEGDVEAEAEGEEEKGGPPNPMKRMWEEPAPVGVEVEVEEGGERVRDEL